MTTWQERVQHLLIALRDPAQRDGVTELAEAEAAGSLEDQVADARRSLVLDRAGTAAFETRLLARWGQALDALELLISWCHWAGHTVNDKGRPAATERQDWKFEALVRLHAKAVLTAREIHLLLTHGYGSGAMARWRSLHEVAVIFALLSTNEGSLSRRYLAHADVESLFAQERYEECWQRLGFDPPDWSPEDRERTRHELSARFGDAFLKTLGWAEPLFGHVPTIRELEARADLDHWRLHYHFASDPVHGGARGSTWSIQTLGDSTVAVAGPSNAGLDEAGQLCAITLMNITVGLLVVDLREFDPPQVSLEHSAEITLGMTLVVALGRLVKTSFIAEGERLKEEDTQRRELQSNVTISLEQDPGLSPAEIAEQIGADIEDVREALVEHAAGNGDRRPPGGGPLARD
jgi:hypothetical protein